MKNILNYDARTLIIARIAATIIPTPIDFNNLIMIIRVFKSRIYSSIVYVCLCFFFIWLQRKAKNNKQEPTAEHFNILFFKKRKTKKAEIKFSAFFVSLMTSDYHFCPLYSSETVSFFLPFARRAANTLRPLADAILSRKPCLFFLFLLEG